MDQYSFRRAKNVAQKWIKFNQVFAVPLSCVRAEQSDGNSLFGHSRERVLWEIVRIYAEKLSAKAHVICGRPGFPTRGFQLDDVRRDGYRFNGEIAFNPTN